LTGAYTSGGACGLIRNNAQNLTNPCNIQETTVTSCLLVYRRCMAVVSSWRELLG